MSGQSDEFILDVLCLLESANILLDDQGERLSSRPLLSAVIVAESSATMVIQECRAHLQALPVGEGEWNGIDHNRERVSLWPIDHFLKLQRGLSVAHGA